MSALCVTAGVRPFRLARWPCSISIHLSPRSVTAGVRPFSLGMRHLYSFVSQVCHWWCPPFSAGHAGILFICLPGLSLLVSALFRWPRNSSIVVFICFPGLSRWCPPFSAGHVAFLFVCLPGLSLLVSALFHWLAGHVAFLFICLPGLSLLVSALFPCSIHLFPRSVTLVSALFRWPRSMSIRLSPRSVTAGVRPFPLAM